MFQYRSRSYDVARQKKTQPAGNADRVVPAGPCVWTRAIARSPVIQTRLTVNAPGDRYEREADRVADQVMRQVEPEEEEEELVQTQALAGTITPLAMRQVDPEEEEEEEEPIQTKLTAPFVEGFPAPPLVQAVVQSPGSPLERGTRAFMEARFGRDFSDVRTHADPQAAQSARLINARAYTVGSDIVLGSREYLGGSRDNLHLLAHELTHVVQQTRTGKPRTLSPGAPGQAGYANEKSPQMQTGRASLSQAVTSQSRKGVVQRIAPAVGIGALAAACIIGAIIGVLADLAIGMVLHMWRRRRWSLRGYRLNYCALVLSAILGCVGGTAAKAWLEPWIQSRLGARLGGVAGTLIGKVLIFIAKKLGVGIPKGVIKKLLGLGCISSDQAEELSPGVTAEMGS